ncbi:MAG TPA: N-methyl-L-tryptophan oxidase [Planctomycetaceae bacterium]|nr:N-methyl-L-tryptophan oxidase [Planctomycetaceae bacterium]
MTRQHYDAIVLGLGGVGSAAVLHAARRNLRVLGLEQYTPAHSRGSSHGHTRVIRKAYFEHPDYVPLLIDAYQQWSVLEEETDTRLFEQVGILQIGHPEGDVCHGVLESAREHGLPIDVLQPVDFRKQFPAVHIADHEIAVLEPQAGFLYIERAVRTQLDQAMDRGAVLQFEEPVREWRMTTNQGVSVTTDRATYVADRLIVAAGPWAERLLPPLAGHLQVLRKHLHWFACSNRHLDLNRFPVFFFETLDGEFYGFPCLDDRGLKVAEHTGGAKIERPEEDPIQVEPADLSRVEAFLSERFPGTAFRHSDHVTCFYTVTPDRHFVVDRHPQHPQVSFAAGLSGHGYKFAPSLGRALVDLAMDGQTELPIDFLHLGRLSGH